MHTILNQKYDCDVTGCISVSKLNPGTGIRTGTLSLFVLYYVIYITYQKICDIFYIYIPILLNMSKVFVILYPINKHYKNSDIVIHSNERQLYSQ